MIPQIYLSHLWKKKDGTKSKLDSSVKIDWRRKILPAKVEGTRATINVATETNKEIFIFVEYLTDPLKRLVMKSQFRLVWWSLSFMPMRATETRAESEAFALYRKTRKLIS